MLEPSHTHRVPSQFPHNPLSTPSTMAALCEARHSSLLDVTLCDAARSAVASRPPVAASDLQLAVHAGDHEDNPELPALLAAIRGGRVAAVADADPGLFLARAGDGSTALHVALLARFTSMDMVNICIDKGSDVNAIDNNNATPLHIAVMREDPDLAAALIVAGASVLPRPCDGGDIMHHLNRKLAAVSSAVYGCYTPTRLLELVGIVMGLSPEQAPPVCPICFTVSILVAVEPCEHQFCGPCLDSWFSTRTNDGAVFHEMHCPDPDCKAPVAPRAVLGCIQDAACRDKLEANSLRACLLTMSDFTRCPTCDNGNGGWRPGDHDYGVVRAAEAPVCGTGAEAAWEEEAKCTEWTSLLGDGEESKLELKEVAIDVAPAPVEFVCGDVLCSEGHATCARCGGEAHPGVDCSQSAVAKAHTWARTAGARHCPNCNAVIEKNGGCNSMFCQACRRAFQWSTAKPVDEKHVPDDSKAEAVQYVYVDAASDTVRTAGGDITHMVHTMDAEYIVVTAAKPPAAEGKEAPAEAPGKPAPVAGVASRITVKQCVVS